MNDYWFQIVRRSRKRYDWVFVAVRDGRPRVLARSGRDYRSRKKTRRAIERLQYAFPRAEVRSNDPFRLPYTKFEIVPGVLPLRVQAPAGSVPASARGGGRSYAAIAPADAPEPQPPEEQQAEPEADLAQTRAEPEQKPEAPGRRRRAT